MPSVSVGWIVVASIAHFDPFETTIDELNDLHESRICQLEAAYAHILSRRKPIRGIPRPVFSSDGLWYPSLSEAARHNHSRADYICSAIRSGKEINGRQWAYVDSIPADFFDGYIKKHIGEFSPWPYITRFWS